MHCMWVVRMCKWWGWCAVCRSLQLTSSQLHATRQQHSSRRRGSDKASRPHHTSCSTTHPHVRWRAHCQQCVQQGTLRMSRFPATPTLHHSTLCSCMQGVTHRQQGVKQGALRHEQLLRDVQVSQKVFEGAVGGRKHCANKGGV